MIVKFLLHKSLPDKNPTIVIRECGFSRSLMVSHSIPEALSSRSRLTEILWNFSRFKDGSRLSLKGNPHFYEKLPTSAEKYVGQFQADPADTILQETISVLTDNPGLTGRVFLEIAKVKRVFVNVWVPKEAIIFKGSCLSVFLFAPPNILLDICGKLEGETIVGSYLANTPNLWCFEEPPLPNDPWPSLPDRSSPPLTPVATRITSPTGALLMDWREPILRMLRSQGIGINIRISDRLPTRFSYGYSGHPLPSPLPSDSISIIGGLSPTPQSRPSLGMQIPGASRGPQYPSSYETVPSIPLTARPLEVETSPSSPSSLSSLSRETPTPMGTSIAAPPTGPAVPDYSIPDTPTLSSRGASLVDLITSQSDTDSILTSPTSTITSPTRRSRPTIGIQIPGAPQGPQYPSSYKPVRSTPLTARPPAVEMSPTSPSSSLSSLFPETPTPTGTGNATALTGQALLDYLALDTPTLSLREPSLVDVIPSQSDTYSISTSPTSTISSPW